MVRWNSMGTKTVQEEKEMRRARFELAISRPQREVLTTILPSLVNDFSDSTLYSIQLFFVFTINQFSITHI